MMEITRRGLLGAALSGGALPLLGWQAPPAGKKRSLRLAFATDMHVQPERRASEGWAACLKHIHALDDRPDLVVTGGDLIMDAFGSTESRAKTQFDLFVQTTKANSTLPVRHTIGNHDVFGWGRGEEFASHKGFGKAWACQALGLEKPYYTFDQGAWRFVVLDSTYRVGNSYTARLDEDQFKWLEATLEATPKDQNVAVVSHIPILMVCAIFDGDNEKTGNWVIPGSYMHIDARRIKDLFLKHPNVKLCLSGHEHQVDEVRYNGVTYLCGGAVSAGWWGGDYFQCTFGYLVVDLFPDGTHQSTYTPFGWKV